MVLPGRTPGRSTKVQPSKMPASVAELNTALAGLAAEVGERLGGGRYVLPAGTLEVDETVQIPGHVYLDGEGPGTVLLAASGFTGNMVENAATTDRRFGIRNLTLDGNGESCYGIFFNTPAGGGPEFADGMWRISDLLVVGTDNGVTLQGRGDGRVYGVDIRDSAQKGLVCESPDNYLDGVIIGGAGSTGFEVSEANNRFTGCKAYYNGLTDATNGHAFWIHDTILCTFQSCEAQDATCHGFYLNGADHMDLQGVIADSNGAGHNSLSFTGHGVVVHNSDFNLVRARCRDRNANTTRQQWGLLLSGWTSVVSVDVMGQGNVLGTADNTTGNTISGRVNGVVGNIT